MRVNSCSAWKLMPRPLAEWLKFESTEDVLRTDQNRQHTVISGECRCCVVELLAHSECQWNCIIIPLNFRTHRNNNASKYQIWCAQNDCLVPHSERLNVEISLRIMAQVDGLAISAHIDAQNGRICCEPFALIQCHKNAIERI